MGWAVAIRLFELYALLFLFTLIIWYFTFRLSLWEAKFSMYLPLCIARVSAPDSTVTDIDWQIHSVDWLRLVRYVDHLLAWTGAGQVWLVCQAITMYVRAKIPAVNNERTSSDLPLLPSSTTSIPTNNSQQPTYRPTTPSLNSSTTQPYLNYYLHPTTPTPPQNSTAISPSPSEQQ